MDSAFAYGNPLEYESVNYASVIGNANLYGAWASHSGL